MATTNRRFFRTSFNLKILKVPGTGLETGHMKVRKSWSRLEREWEGRGGTRPKVSTLRDPRLDERWPGAAEQSSLGVLKWRETRLGR